MGQQARACQPGLSQLQPGAGQPGAGPALGRGHRAVYRVGHGPTRRPSSAGPMARQGRAAAPTAGVGPGSVSPAG